MVSTTMAMTTEERGRSIELLARLDLDVATKQQALIEARVMLGHVVRTLRERYERHDVEAVIEAARVHRRRVSEAVRLAEHFALEDGKTDWEKIRAKQAERGGVGASAGGRGVGGAAPSIRSLVGMVRDVPARVEEIEEPVEAPEGYEFEPAADADAEFDEELEPVEIPDDGADVVAAERAELAYVRSIEPKGLEAAAATVIGQGVRGKAWAVGPQMTMEGLYERANGLADDLERVLDRCGFVDAGDLLSPIRERLGRAASNVR